MLMNDTTAGQPTMVCSKMHELCVLFAAALAYSIYQEDLPRNERNSQKVVFVDLGYSSLQVAVCAISESKLKVSLTVIFCFI